jgi:hypothetical protein
MIGSRERGGRQIPFVLDGKRRRVPLASVAAVRRGGRPVAPLVDLWVASALPGDLFENCFEIVAEDATGKTVCSVPIDGPLLTRAFVDVATLRLWWDGPNAGVPHGLVVQSVVIRSARWQPLHRESA